ncbi:MAG: phosphate/phosphite/phosphonate ABC transporter substrate-binding protein [Chloroflexi bacterium]|nr:phosphate/phosphite/phosphonate ABC transporter substrate-binding protein [Chloroflexota bacterium]
MMVGVALALGGFLVGCQPQPTTKQKLVVAIQPTLAAQEMLEKAKPLEKFLEDKLGPGVDVEVYVPLSQAGVIEALRFGQAHVAFMGAWPAQLAVELGGAELALAEVREVIIGDQKKEETFYFSYWVVTKASPFKSLKELQGKRACFPSAVSGSGYVGPMGRMVELGLLPKPAQGKEVDPKGFFGQVIFGGGYAQCWDALKAGQVDVAIIAGDVSEKLYNEVLASTNILEKQGPLPSHGVVLSKELKEPLRSKVVEAVKGLGAPEYRDLMRGFISGIFVGFKATDAQTHLGSFRVYLEQTRLGFQEQIRR